MVSAVVKCETGQPGASTGLAEQGVEAGAGEAENRIMSELESAAKHFVRLAAQWNAPSCTVFSHRQGYAIDIYIHAPNAANLSGAHAGSEGE